MGKNYGTPLPMGKHSCPHENALNDYVCDLIYPPEVEEITNPATTCTNEVNICDYITVTGSVSLSYPPLQEIS